VRSAVSSRFGSRRFPVRGGVVGRMLRWGGQLTFRRAAKLGELLPLSACAGTISVLGGARPCVVAVVSPSEKETPASLSASELSFSSAIVVALFLIVMPLSFWLEIVVVLIAVFGLSTGFHGRFWISGSSGSSTTKFLVNGQAVFSNWSTCARTALNSSDLWISSSSFIGTSILQYCGLRICSTNFDESSSTHQHCDLASMGCITFPQLRNATDPRGL
jgi:hypothetical protein